MTVEAKSCGQYSEWRGYNLNTVSGHPVWPADPRPEDIRTVDIAWALARQCRFRGHLKPEVEFYSIAQHSVMVYNAITIEFPDDIPLRRAALFHDAEEYIEGDIPTPIKKMDKNFHDEVKHHMGDFFEWLIGNSAVHYFERVKKLNAAIAEKYNFNVGHFEHKSVKRADYRAFLTEKRDIIHVLTTDFGEDKDEPFPVAIDPLMPKAAAKLFLDTCREVGINY